MIEQTWIGRPLARREDPRFLTGRSRFSDDIALDGQAQAFQRSFDLMSGERAWVVLAEGEERAVDEAIAKQRGFDPDLWVIEVEDRAGRHLLDEPGLAD